MVKTAVMRLIELMIMKEDVDPVIEYLGKKAVFQFYTRNSDSSSSQNSSKEIFENLQIARSYLDIPDLTDYESEPTSPKTEDFSDAAEIISAVDALREKEIKAKEELKKVEDAYKEAAAFANLKVSYSELEHLSFLTMRIGKIDPAVLDDLEFALGEHAVIIPLGDDKTRVMAACSRKSRFALDSELKKFGFIPLEKKKIRDILFPADDRSHIV